MIPKPRLNLLVYHGVFAPHARWRGDAVRRAVEGAASGTTAQRGGGEAGPAACDVTPPTKAAVLAGSLAGQRAPPASAPPTDATDTAATPQPTPSEGYKRPTHYAWADLWRRTFAIDVLACPECGGRLRLLATIDDSAVIDKILRHLGLPIELPAPAPARTPAWLSSTLPIFDGPAEPAGLWSH